MANPHGRSVMRLRGGFLLGPAPISSEWGSGWEHHARNRPLVHCHLQVQLTHSSSASISVARLTIYPILRPTYYLPLYLSLPVPPGTPIVLLPHGAPAFYLSTYAGPASALTSQFEEALVGLGVGDWARTSPSNAQHGDTAFPASASAIKDTPTYVIAWLAVQNKQGEDKGMPVVWPARLCISFHPSSPSVHARTPLAYIPELPAQLQSSPPPPAPTIPQSLSLASIGPSGSDAASATSPAQSIQASLPDSERLSSSMLRRPNTLSSSPTSDSLRAFRTLSLAQRPYARNIRKVAAEVSGYVDFVAKEREKERERLRRERQEQDATNARARTASITEPTAEMDVEPAPESDESTSALFSPPEISVDLPSSDDSMQVRTEPPAGAAANLPPILPSSSVPSTPDLGSSNMDGFDPFNGFDNSWSQQSNGFMDMNMDYDIGFNMNISSMDDGRGGGNTAGNFDLDDGFGVFTEDDFDFFDGPAAQRAAAAPVLASTVPVDARTPFPPAATPVPLVFALPLSGEAMTMSGPGPPSVGLKVDSPWTTQLGEGFTPRAIETLPLPDGVPPAPTCSLHPRRRHLHPIRRPQRHACSSLTMRKLIGVKRKSFDQGVREVRKTPTWLREDEEWEGSSAREVDINDEVMSEADSEDEEPWVDDDDASSIARPSTPPPSYLPLGPTLLQTHFHHSHLLPLSAPLRPPGAAVDNSPAGAAPMSVPTPVSPAAVLGAASEKSKSLEAAAQILIHEVVENSIWSDAWRANAVLSHSSSRPPIKVWQSDIKQVAAFLGSTEMVQSPVDLQTLSTPLDLVLAESSDSPVASSALIKMLDSPVLAVGKADSVVQVSPTALRFWEKLGLGPRPGRKDITAFIFFEHVGDDREAEVEEWLGKVSATYAAKNYGLHSAGISSQCTKAGLVPVRFDIFRKTLVNFVSTLPSLECNLVFYIVTPAYIITSTSTVLRQLFSAVKRIHKAHPDTQILFHFVPESLVTGILTNPQSSLDGLEPFVDSVYDRILQPVERAMSRKLFTHSARTRAYFHAPAYTLARSALTQSQGSGSEARVLFVLEPHPSSLDVVDRYALLHVGYTVTPCGRWVLAACVDARGEAHELRAWLTPGDGVESFVVAQVWTLLRDFAKRADLEWRLVISKLGLMGSAELDMWISHLESAVLMSAEIPPMHVTLLAVDHDNPWTFLAPDAGTTTNIVKRTSASTSSSSRTSARMPSGAAFADMSYATYALYPSSELTSFPTPSSTSPNGPGASVNTAPGSADLSFVPDSEEEEPIGQSQQMQTPSMRAQRASTLVCVPAGTDYTSISTVHLYQLYAVRSLRSTFGKRPTASQAGTSSAVGEVPEQSRDMKDDDRETLHDITRNFHDLAVLARARWKLRADPALPFHLAALDVMRTTLSAEGD
ncbi:Mediator of RNA polymerase II transcription subunit 13 [Grifola frondosa]|uniref:Mediator of RNA polymerase II transcription subunit 13 n=1 Tax=Grifola frondosa TaxID=5627 RepID=A0A1C7M4Z0_GRIFR|nr:Mediator of RNA polymerase II transcription subunit 13 [Grifola frondosa]